MKKYMIDKEKFNGHDCIEQGRMFETCEDAKAYLAQYITKVEVGYLVTMQIGDAPSRYVWTTEDVDNGGCVDCPNGTDDCYNTDIEACFVRDELEEYAEEKGYTNVIFGMEEVIL